MKISAEVRATLAGLAAPEYTAAYFEGRRKVYACAVDDLLLFSRREARELRRRSAESHLHRRFVLVVCVDGAGTLSVDGIPFSMKPGQAHLVFPQSYHHFIQLEKPELLWFFITFETGEGERLAVLRQRTFELSADDFGVLNRMANLFSSLVSKGDALSLEMSRLLCGWCERVAGEAGELAKSPIHRNQGLWQRLQVQLEKLPPDLLRVGPLAGKLAISERHLREKFSEQFGVSIGKYLRNYRLRRAVGLLITSDLSVTEIADLCGYQTSPSFHRAFLKHTGMAPGRFRKERPPVS